MHARRLALLSAAVASGGCGSSVLAGPHPLTRLSLPSVVLVSLTEYRLRPDRIVAPAGPVTFVVHNLGRLTHDLVISAPAPAPPAGAGGAVVVGTTAPIPPGGEATLVVTLPGGDYTLTSTIQTDAALGEHGSLKVIG